MSRKGESITLSLDTADKAALETIALQYGCIWGDKPNVSALLKEIARGRLVVYYSDDKVEVSSRAKQGKAAINKVHQGLQELSAILF